MPARLPLPLLLALLAAGGCRSGRGEAPTSPTPADAGAPAPTCTAPAVGDPGWVHDGVGYEVFVRSFQDSDGDGVGDLRGLADRLDYLNDGDPAGGDDLGIDVLWLMPILESPSYHGYDVTDYGHVSSAYGTDADLDALLEAARARGIRVLLDLVLNHTSRQHGWFVNSASGPDAGRRDWYVWRDDDPGWQRPWGAGATWHRHGDAWFYGLFSSSMPDLNFGNPAVGRTMTDVALRWLERGFDGFRLDAVRYLVETGGGEGQADTPETHAWLRALRLELQAAHPEALLLGEAWTDNAVVAGYFGSRTEPELHAAFDFDGAAALVSALRVGRAGTLRTVLCRRFATFPAHGVAANLLTNHDMVRLPTELAGVGPGVTRVAAALLLALPGMPWIYYGEELGQHDGTVGGGEAHRLPMPWEDGPAAGFTSGTPWLPPASTRPEDTVAGQTSDPDSHLSLYRSLVRLRRALAPLRRGGASFLAADPACPGLLPLRRQLGDEGVLALLNLGSDGCEVRVAGADLPRPTPRDALTDEPLTPEPDGSLRLTLPGRGFRFLR